MFMIANSTTNEIFRK